MAKKWNKSRNLSTNPNKISLSMTKRSSGSKDSLIHKVKSMLKRISFLLPSLKSTVRLQM